MKFRGIFWFAVLIFLFASNLFAEESQNKFKPAWWCRGGHFQTIYGGLFRPNPKIPLTHERFETPDGDFLNIDRLDGPPDSPLVIILHGLGSSGDVPYVHSLIDEIRKLGWRAVSVHARGSGQELNRLTKIHHGGKTEDLDAVVNDLIRHERPETIYLVGYSLGGNLILKWLGEKSLGVPKEVKKAVVVSVPYDLSKAAHHLDHGFNQKVYTRFLLKGLKNQALRKEKQFPGIIDVQAVEHADTFEVFDREVTARLNGFKDEQDYWTQSSSVHYLREIKIPVLLIHAANDPFLQKESLPLETIQSNPNLKLILTSDGGHLGFVSGKIPFRPISWLEQVILNHFKN